MFCSDPGREMKAIRGAICAEGNTKAEIYRATQHLLQEIVRRNDLRSEDVQVAFFTMTPDLDAEYPAYAARDMGWTTVPMLGAQETPVPGAHQRAIRVLVLARGEGSGRHVYLGRAAQMRPDLAEPGDDEAWPSRPSLERSGSTHSAGNLVVIGLGLIGGSVAAGARASGRYRSVLGHDRDPARAQRALELGLVDGIGSPREQMAEADLVVLATPVDAIVGLLPRIAEWARAGTVITDVGSTKGRITDVMSRLPERLEAIGGHPMTGGTSSGPQAAKAELFRGAAWALVPNRRTGDVARARVRELVAALGARPVELEAALHDRVVAYTSHMPALVAVAISELGSALYDEVGSERWLIGPGYRSATRLAAGGAEMTAQMIAENAVHVRAALAGLVDRLLEWSDMLEAPSADLTERLSRVGRIRSVLIREKAGAVPVAPKEEHE